MRNGERKKEKEIGKENEIYKGEGIGKEKVKERNERGETE